MTAEASNKPKHAAAPALCGTCSATMRSRIEIGALQTGYVHCPHRNTLAIFTVEHRRVVGWNVIGPIPAHIAMEHVQRLAANLERGLAASDLQSIESPAIN